MKRSSKTAIPAKFPELPKNYATLCTILRPRTIHDEIELENVTKFIDLMAGRKLTKDQADYVNTPATHAADFEDQNVAPLPELAPNELLASHLGNIGMSASKWGNSSASTAPPPPASSVASAASTPLTSAKRPRRSTSRRNC